MKWEFFLSSLKGRKIWLQVCESRCNEIGVVLQHSYPDVARPAKHAPHAFPAAHAAGTASVVMVNAGRACRAELCSAYLTPAECCRDKRVNLILI